MTRTPPDFEGGFPGGPAARTFVRNVSFWTLIVLSAFFLYKFLGDKRGRVVEIPYSDFMSAVEKGEIREVVIEGNEVTGDFVEADPTDRPRRFRSYSPDVPSMVKELRASNVTVVARKERRQSTVTALLSWLPIGIVIGIWLYFMRYMRK